MTQTRHHQRRGAVVATLAAAVLATTALATAAPASADGNADSAKRCQNGAWKTLTRADGTAFASQGDCVSYGAQGGTLVVVPVVDVFFVPCQDFPGFVMACAAVTAAGLEPGSTLEASITLPGGGGVFPTLVVGADGTVPVTPIGGVGCSAGGGVITVVTTARGTAPDGTTVGDTETTTLDCG